jgi:hypothetical protein
MHMPGHSAQPQVCGARNVHFRTLRFTGTCFGRSSAHANAPA